jgi:hypothetical protein
MRNAEHAPSSVLDESGGTIPPGGIEADGAFEDNPVAQHFAMYAFAAPFAGVRVDEAGTTSTTLMEGLL